MKKGKGKRAKVIGGMIRKFENNLQKALAKNRMGKGRWDK